MANLNQVNITGTLGQDAEYKSFSNGGGVCNFSVAVSEKWKDQHGQLQERTEWIPVANFSKSAQNLTQYLKKGTQVRVCGKFKTRQWEDQNGIKRYKTEVVVDGFGTDIELLGSPSNNQAQQPQNSYYTQQPQQQTQPQPQYEQHRGGNAQITNQVAQNPNFAGATGAVVNANNAPVDDEDIPF